jgi:hypothetical protein
MNLRSNLSSVAWLCLVIVAALEQRLIKLVPDRVWSPFAHLMPGFQFGYVMFDVIPVNLPYYRMWLGARSVPAETIDANFAFAYSNARFQINAMLEPAYLRDVCRSSGKNFEIERVVRDLKTRVDTVTAKASCSDGRLEP